MAKRADYLMVDEDDPDFKRWWFAYPKHCAKKDARKAWAELAPSAETVEKMMAALEWQVLQPQWTKDGGQYVPYPSSYLRAERWEDEMPAHLRPRERRCQYGHQPPCDTWQDCTRKMLADRKAG
jgi:hypothetical protein